MYVLYFAYFPHLSVSNHTFFVFKGNIQYMTFRTSRCRTRAQHLGPKQMDANEQTSFKLNRNKIKLTKTVYK